MATLAPLHPGEALLGEFLVPVGWSQSALARSLGVPAARIHDLVRGRRGLNGDLALRLAAHFETSPEFWMNLQSHYELESARDRLGGAIDGIGRADRS